MTDSATRFVPAHPPRPETFGPWWSGFFGERARNSVAGWSKLAFEQWHVRRRMMRLVIHFPRHPDAVERVLLTNAANYQKPRIIKKLLMPMLGRGLLTADGELWRSQRKVVAPSFAPGAVARLAGTMAGAAERQMADWPTSGRIDIAHAATETTMRIIADALFSDDARLTTAEASRHITAALEAAGAARLSALFGLNPLPITRSVRVGQRGRRYLRETLTSIVRERGPEGGDDFLGGMIRDLNARFPPAEATMLAIDNAATFYLAGHETTANALAWAIYLLAGDQRAQDRARNEALAAVAGDPATLADRLPYLRQVLDETLRLYPPAPRFDREAVAADMLHGEPVGPGDLVSIWPWLIHRHRQLWDDADAFDPERFAPGREAARHRFQYIPFGAGPRTCVGARFAIVEALVILTHWLSARRFALVEGHTVELHGSVTLRPKGGLPVMVSAI
ncbi:cytochrome P450 [Sphingomonas gilva]|uniref:Cytochrome P450 n=1 Tax=Sphingomonas gilva TaxID=2305907 RepID=A0A396RP97_9SPHN|nr:cytochrome P450 [Sphingomonas gilva]RHW18367.1 cytochrome P450 [Sphingomonas gilva]